MDRLFSTFEVAKICQVSPASVSRWIREGRLVSSVTAGGHHRVGAETLRTFLKALRMPVPPELTPRQPRRVLIADPDPKTRKMLRRCLEASLSGLEIEEAGDGFEAGWKAHGMKPNLIILDFSILASAAGAEPDFFLKNLTGADQSSLILTGNQKEMNGVKRKNLNKVKAFVIKPFDAELLRQRARECLYGETEGGRRAKAG